MHSPLQNLNCFIVLDKAPGMTSQSAVTRLRKILGIKKAGHTGTLDPLATGVLPIALGHATKAIPFLDESLKVYEVESQLGQTTDTDDADGQILVTRDTRHLREEKVVEMLQNFYGEIEQRPPIYSAIKVGGRKLYQYARRGTEVEIPLRKVKIFNLELLEFSSETLKLRITCSPGTYIRSLVRDLGENLGCGAHVKQLRRLQSGIFNLTQAVTLDELKNQLESAERKFLSIETCLEHLPRLSLLSEKENERIHCGVLLWRLQEELKNANFLGDIAIDFEEKIVAIVHCSLDGGISFKQIL